MKLYSNIFDLFIYFLLAGFFVFWISVVHENEALHVKVKALEEEITMADTKLDSESFRRVECESVLNYVSGEAVRLTDKLIKGKK